MHNPERETRNVLGRQGKGAVAAGDLQTAQAGAAILRRGGNAVDAAVAAAFTSFVAEMVLVNIGGGGIALVHLADSGTTTVYDFFSDAPSGHYDPGRADFKRILVDFGAAQQPFYIGRASVAVPGDVAGLCALADQHGILPLKTLLAPAVQLARQGIILSDSQAYIAGLLADIFMDTPESAAIYAPQGRIIRAGERLQNRQLAQTLTLLGELGADYFYRGSLAERIVLDQEAYGGIITRRDLAGYRTCRRAAIEVPYRGYTILLPPLSSLGGALIAFSLKLLGSADLTMMTPFTCDHLRLLAEVMRLTNIARRELEIERMEVARFLSAAHVETYRQGLVNLLKGGEPPAEPVLGRGPNDTTHISVIDARGNMVSVTTSAGEGAGFVVGDTGVTLNNMLGELDLHPNGFHQAPAETRLQTMMSPIIVLKNERPILTLGSGGSTRLRSAILQVLSNVIDFDMPLTEAVRAPRVHFEDGVLQLEGGMAKDVSLALSDLGYTVNFWPGKNMYFGGVHAVSLIDGHFRAAGDTRRGGVGLIVAD